MLYLSLTKVFLASAGAFFIGMSLTPILTNWLYKNKMWKKKAGKIAPDGRETPIFNELHKHKEVGTPRMGGVVIWGSVLLTTLSFWLISMLWPDYARLNFLSRNQTWLPLFTLFVGAIVGLIDDWQQVKAEHDCKNAGLPFSQRLLIVIMLALIGGYWFYFKLDLMAITVPFIGVFYLGWLIIPLFVLSL